MSEEEAAQPQFVIEKLYVKDISLECPNSPELFLDREAPQIEVKLFNQGKQVGEGLYEVALTVTVTAKLGERTAYLAEVAQAGVFRSEERRVGKECCGTCRSRWSPYH